MLSLLDLSRVRRVLCIGAHSDDIEIGAGGLIARLAAENPAIEFRWVVFGCADSARRDEAAKAAKLFVPNIDERSLSLHAFRDGFFEYQGERLKEHFEKLKSDFEPDLILTHHDDDRHQDHRLVSRLTWNTWRNHAILEYEIMKYDGDLGRPNVFVPLSKEAAERKIANLFAAFATQTKRQWFTEDVFRSLLRLRGVECNAPSGYAEAFHARKIVAG